MKRLFEKRKENINVRISLEKTVQELSTDVINSFYIQRKPANLSANGFRCFIVI